MSPILSSTHPFNNHHAIVSAGIAGPYYGLEPAPIHKPGCFWEQLCRRVSLELLC